MEKGGPDFDEALRIFNKKFVRVPPMPSPHGGPLPSTAHHGNESWRYLHVAEQTEKVVTLGFNPAGELSAVIIEMKKN
jgi:hypothetical protein